MHNLFCRFICESAEITHHFFTHCDEGVATLEKISCEGNITRPLLMWQNIICYGYNPAVMIFPEPSQDYTQCRTHER